MQLYVSPHFMHPMWGRMVSCAPVGNRRLLASLTKASGGLPTRRRLPACPTSAAGFAASGKLSAVVKLSWKSPPKIVYTRKRSRSFRLVHGKLVKIQHSPATVSAENRPIMPLFRRRNGKGGGFDEAQVRRPASE